jgi:hypothetical protein
MNFTRFVYFLEKQNGKGRAGLDLHCHGPDLACCGRRIASGRKAGDGLSRLISGQAHGTPDLIQELETKSLA